MHRSSSLFLRLTGALLLIAGCSPYEPFDSVGELRKTYAQQLDAQPSTSESPTSEPTAESAKVAAEKILVPFELDAEVLAAIDAQAKPAPRELDRIEQVNDLIFRKRELQYALTPTRSAVDTWHAREGNCLSFVHLFVGVARHLRLAPFYVEVDDFQRWRHQNGMVLSQGHIVAGMYVNGDLRTFDFLPYRPKSYKQFKPIDDLTAAAHHYNNLAAEALIVGDTETALAHLDTAIRLVPTFEKALNNLGVIKARDGEEEHALEIYLRGLENAPGNVPILSNLARLYQQMGRLDDAEVAMEQIEGAQTANPFYFIYRGELALSRDEHSEALQYLRRALRLDTEIPEVHVGLARVYLALGDLDKARHHVERALKLDATHRDARELATLLEGY